MEKRFFVLKGIKLGSGDLKAGSYLSEEDANELGEKGLYKLTRLALILDITGKIHLPRLDNDKRRKRLRYLSAIGTDESRRVLGILESQDNKVRLVYNERAAQRSAARKRTAQGLPPIEEKVADKSKSEPDLEPSLVEPEFKPLNPDDVLNNQSESKGKKGRKRGR